MVTQVKNAKKRKIDCTYPSALLNLAVEETIARNFSTGSQTQPTVRLWVNPKSVILGRFQSVRSEVDLVQCHLNDVQIARRFTGGGAVFHDEGTLNFTITSARPESSLLEFQEANLRLVLDALGNLGVRCSASSPNSILVEGRKICGAACAVGIDFGIWHCSVLVDTNVQLLESTLAPSRSKANSRFVRSKWQPVTTLSIALRRRVGVGEVMRTLESTIEERFGRNLEASGLSTEEEECLQVLYTQKYSLDEWNMEGERGFVYGKESGRANHTTIAV